MSIGLAEDRCNIVQLPLTPPLSLLRIHLFLPWETACFFFDFNIIHPLALVLC